MATKLDLNKAFYDEHWRHAWKARFMYDPVSKRNIARHVLREAGYRDGTKNILDIGFGFGLTTFMFERSNSITGIELARSAVELAQRRASRLGYENPRFLQYSGEGKIPLPDNSFDLIICSHVLEHVHDDNFLLSEIKRMMKSQGLAFLNIPINEEHFSDPRHQRKYTVAGFLDQVKSHGFKVTSSFEGDRLWNTFGWFFEKDYHNRIPILGFVLSSVLNIFFSSIPFGVERWYEDKFMRRLKPRQFAVCVTK